MWTGLGQGALILNKLKYFFFGEGHLMSNFCCTLTDIILNIPGFEGIGCTYRDYDENAHNQDNFYCVLPEKCSHYYVVKYVVFMVIKVTAKHALSFFVDHFIEFLILVSLGSGCYLELLK